MQTKCMFMFTQLTRKRNIIISIQKIRHINITVQELQNQMRVSENQSSHVPYITFFQLMKFSYKARLFHSLSPAYGSILRKLIFPLTKISCMMKVFQSILPVKIIQK